MASNSADMLSLEEIFNDSGDEEEGFAGFSERDLENISIADLRRYYREVENESEDEESDEDGGENGDEDGGARRRWSDDVNVLQDVHDFTEIPGLQVLLPANPKPIDFFTLFFPDELVERICRETNHYANSFYEDAQETLWKDITPGEFYVFSGYIFAMGLTQKQNLKDYWSTDEVHNIPFFGKYLSRDRFFSILRFLHFNNNNDFVARGNEGYDPLFKIRPVYDKMRELFASTYKPTQNLSLDESAIGWKGNLHYRVYNPSKAHKFHIKSYVLAEAESGYIVKFEVYTGKKDQASAFGSTYDIVMELVHNYLDKGYRVFMDNYYSGVDLFTRLHESGTLACGTVRSNRKGLPDILNTKLKKGEVVSARSGSLLALKWKDKRDVRMLSTLNTAEVTDTGKVDRRTQQPIRKPEVVQEYNKHMGGVDLSDQLMQYNCYTRRTLKYYKKLFFHLHHLAAVQGFIIYKKTTNNTPVLLHRQFIHHLVKDLLLKGSETTEIQRPVSSGRRSADANDISRLTGRHFPSFIAPKPGAKKDKPTRRCEVCKERAGATGRVETRYCCEHCQCTPLCIIPCFQIYHTVVNYKQIGQ